MNDLPDLPKVAPEGSGKDEPAWVRAVLGNFPGMQIYKPIPPVQSPPDGEPRSDNSPNNVDQ